MCWTWGSSVLIMFAVGALSPAPPVIIRLMLDKSYVSLSPSLTKAAKNVGKVWIVSGWNIKVYCHTGKIGWWNIDFNAKKFLNTVNRSLEMSNGLDFWWVQSSPSVQSIWTGLYPKFWPDFWAWTGWTNFWLGWTDWTFIWSNDDGLDWAGPNFVNGPGLSTYSKTTLVWIGLG